MVVPVAAALIAVACGGQSRTTTHAQTQTTADAPARTTTATPATVGDCNALGINPTGMREGTCTHGGITYVIVDEDHTVKLRTLSGSLSGIHIAKSLMNDAAVATAHGDFLVATLSITNELAHQRTFDRGHTQQTGLILDGTVYKEDVGGENADPNSCLRQKGGPIRPGDTLTCDVVFDVPGSAAADLGKHGSGDLYLINFGLDLSGSTLPYTVGQIRLYH
jgi:hypothetical protein